MAYIPFDATKPDGASQNGTQFASSIRANFEAIRDGLVVLTFRGWNITVDPTGSDYTTPSAWVYSKGSEVIKSVPTRIVGGVASGLTSRLLVTYSSNGISYVTVGAENYTYDAEATFVSSHWSF